MQLEWNDDEKDNNRLIQKVTNEETPKMNDTRSHMKCNKYKYERITRNYTRESRIQHRWSIISKPKTILQHHRYHTYFHNPITTGVFNPIIITIILHQNLGRKTKTSRNKTELIIKRQNMVSSEQDPLRINCQKTSQRYGIQQLYEN